MTGVVVEVTRGGRPESTHVVDVAVADADGRLAAWAGAPDRSVFARSAIKPFQAMPLVEDGVLQRFGLSDEELALCCASHSGEPRHVETVRGMLARAGVGEPDLACGAHPPFNESSARSLTERGVAPGRIHNNCSGKHAGMLALARARGWETEGYHEPGHPVQLRMREELARWSGVPEADLETAVDGCGVATFALPLTGLARAFARLSKEAEPTGTPAWRVVGAMTDHPFLVAGTGRLCTRLMELAAGRLVAKVGAEGVYGAAVRPSGLGVALKVRDGARRAAEVALLGVLAALDALSGEELEALAAWATPIIRNTRGEAVGEVRSRVELERSHG